MNWSYGYELPLQILAKNIDLNKKPTNWLGQAKRHTTEIRPQIAGDGIFGRYSNYDNSRPEVVADVISDGAEE